MLSNVIFLKVSYIRNNGQSQIQRKAKKNNHLISCEYSIAIINNNDNQMYAFRVIGFFVKKGNKMKDKIKSKS